MRASTVFYAAFLLGTVLVGCVSPRTVTIAELENAKSHWQEPKVSIWYYVGSDAGYHYYLHRDLPGDTLLRVAAQEHTQADPFPRTTKEKLWRVMPWGVLALREQGQ